MSNEIRKTAEAIAKVGETFPIYQDLLQPAVQELGKGAHTLSKTVHIALSPVSALVWGYDQIKDYIHASLEEKLKKTPKENIVPPDPSVAGPAIDGLRYTGHKEELRELFSSLLATAMDSKTADNAHPSFVEIIKQLNSDEAKLLKEIRDRNQPTVHVSAVLDDGSYFPLLQHFCILAFQAECEVPHLIFSYLGNLSRLGLIKLEDSKPLSAKSVYDDIINHQLIQGSIEQANFIGKAKLDRAHFSVTPFGKQFYEACVLEK